MYGLIREEGSFGKNPSTKDLAKHLYTRMFCGKVVIVADNPKHMLSPLRKQWLKLARKVQLERAKTLDPARIQELTNCVARMHTLKFKAGWDQEKLDFEGQYDVHIATVDRLLGWPPDCRTMYVTCAVEPEDLHRLTAWMSSYPFSEHPVQSFWRFA